MMKKMLLTAVAAIMAMPSMAQYVGPFNSSYTEEHNVYYGLRLGWSLATVNSDDDILDGGSVRSGLNIGAVIGFQLSPAAPVYLETGLFYTEKGGNGRVELSDGVTSERVKFTYDLNYLELPILAKYKYDIDGNFSIQPFAGGWLACGVGGKVKNYGTSKDNRAAYSSFSGDFFKRFDGGLRIGCGAEYQMIYAEMAYDFGLANICHSDFDTSRTGCFYLNFGVNF